MNLYEQYVKNDLNLSAFGIERGESRSDSFCTPKGAKIIGWTGTEVVVKANDKVVWWNGSPRALQDEGRFVKMCTAVFYLQDN